MYQIIKMLNGRYQVLCKIQDGTERWYEDKLEAAIDSLRKAAETLNHTKIKKKDIEYLVEKPVVESSFIKVKRKQMA